MGDLIDIASKSRRECKSVTRTVMKNDFFVEKIIWEIFFLSIKHTFTDRAYQVVVDKGINCAFLFQEHSKTCNMHCLARNCRRNWLMVFL